MSEERERNPRCPRCGGALKFETCIVGGDSMYAVEDEAVCMSCSRRIAQPRFVDNLREISLDEMRQHVGKYAPSEYPRKPRETKPCRVVECRARAVSYSKSGLCSTCAQSQHLWDKSRKLNPPPFLTHPDCLEMLTRNPDRKKMVRNPAPGRCHVG